MGLAIVSNRRRHRRQNGRGGQAEREAEPLGGCRSGSAWASSPYRPPPRTRKSRNSKRRSRRSRRGMRPRTKPCRRRSARSQGAAGCCCICSAIARTIGCARSSRTIGLPGPAGVPAPALPAKVLMTYDRAITSAFPMRPETTRSNCSAVFTSIPAGTSTSSPDRKRSNRRVWPCMTAAGAHRRGRQFHGRLALRLGL